MKAQTFIPSSAATRQVSSQAATRATLQRRPFFGGDPAPTAAALPVRSSFGQVAVNSVSQASIQAKLRVSQPGDQWEMEADRVADDVASGDASPGGGFSFSRMGVVSVQRQEEAKPKSEEEKYKDAAKKVGEAFLETDLGKKLKGKAVEKGKEFVSTPEGMVITGTAAAGAVAAIVATNSELPIQVPSIPLDALAPGLKMKITYEGPVLNPTKAMIVFSGTFGGPKKEEKKPAMTESEKIRAENARMTAELAQFRESLKTPEQKKEEAAAWDAFWRMKGMGPLGIPGLRPKKEEEETLQPKAARDAAGPQSIPPIVDEVIGAPGQSLDMAARSYMEARFGYDFSRVRVHTDARAAESARAVNARAYTLGSEVVFGSGQYAPKTNEGRRLLAHEMAHVVQQGAMLSRTERPLIQREPKEPTTEVGPISGEGGLIYDSSTKRLSIIIGPGDTLRSIAKKLLPLWSKAAPFTPEGASKPLPLTSLTVEQLAKGLLVYNQYFLAVPSMTEWKVGLRFPLPIEVNQVTGERTLNPDLIATWAKSFDTAWTPLLDQKAGAVRAPSTGELEESVKTFLETTTTPMARGIHLSARAIKNAVEAEPFIKEVLRQLGSEAFDTALAFMDSIVSHQVDLLASQRAGLEIIDAVRNALSKAPATLSPAQQTSLARANLMFSRLGVFSAETAETFERIYIKDVPGCHCMSAVYKGLEGLFSKEVSKSISTQVTKDAAKVMKKTGRDTNHMDRIMETVRARGKAGPMIRLTYIAKSKTWDPDPETTILGMTHPTVAGWYFFGLSLHAAYHSVILAVDKTDPTTPQIYWMDQFSKGFTKNVTGKLPAEMRSWEPSYGFSPSKLWQIMPAADTLIELR